MEGVLNRDCTAHYNIIDLPSVYVIRPQDFRSIMTPGIVKWTEITEDQKSPSCQVMTQKFPPEFAMVDCPVYRKNEKIKKGILALKGTSPFTKLTPYILEQIEDTGEEMVSNLEAGDANLSLSEIGQNNKVAAKESDFKGPQNALLGFEHDLNADTLNDVLKEIFSYPPTETEIVIVAMEIDSLLNDVVTDGDADSTLIHEIETYLKQIKRFQKVVRGYLEHVSLAEGNEKSINQKGEFYECVEWVNLENKRYNNAACNAMEITKIMDKNQNENSQCDASLHVSEIDQNNEGAASHPPTESEDAIEAIEVDSLLNDVVTDGKCCGEDAAAVADSISTQGENVPELLSPARENVACVNLGVESGKNGTLDENENESSKYMVTNELGIECTENNFLISTQNPVTFVEELEPLAHSRAGSGLNEPSTSTPDQLDCNVSTPRRLSRMRKTKNQDVSGSLATETVQAPLFDEGMRLRRSKRKAIDAGINGTKSSQPDLEAENRSMVKKAPVTESTRKIKCRERIQAALNRLHGETIGSLGLPEKPPPGPGTYDLKIVVDRPSWWFTTKEHIKFDPHNELDQNFLVRKDFVLGLLDTFP